MLKAGDTIEITDSMFLKLLQKYKAGLWTPLKVGAKGKLMPRRDSRKGGYMCIFWNNGKTSSCKILDDLGIKYETPKFDEISLDDCCDELLGEQELIRKYLRKKYDTPAKKYTADVWLDLIISIMNELDIVFYEP